MNVPINPSKLTEPWDEGYCLDLHTIESVFLGYNEFGHPEFSTTRSPVGDLLYRLKYQHDASALEPLVETVVAFLTSWNLSLQEIVPVPPSNPTRKSQPVLEVAGGVSARLHVPLCHDCISKVKKTGELKNIFDFQQRAAILDGAFDVDVPKTAGKRILLFDDLYRSGATMNTIARLLRGKGSAVAVYALTLTRTRSKS